MMRALLLLSLMLPAVVLADASYKLDLGATVGNGSLKVEPTVSGPPGKVLAYEMKVKREGGAGSSSSSQSGTVALGPDGIGHLASSSVSVGSGDRYRVSVRVVDHGRVVAEDSTSIP
jgi:hypothetical protein